MAKTKIEIKERSNVVHAEITFVSGKTMRITFWDGQEIAEITNNDSGVLVVQPVVSNQVRIRIIND